MRALPADLVSRRPVWEALSDLFLDTDVSLSRAWRIGQLSESPFEIVELERTLIEEVYPVCKYNLVGVAGVWSGFDLEWLERKILSRRDSPYRSLHGLDLGRLAVPRWSEWRTTKAAIAAVRKGSEGRCS